MTLTERLAELRQTTRAKSPPSCIVAVRMSRAMRERIKTEVAARQRGPMRLFR